MSYNLLEEIYAMTKEEIINAANERSSFNKNNEIKIVDFGDDFCIVEGVLCEKTMNPMGMAHGGFVYSLCDVAAGVAASRLNRRGVTLSGNVYYLRPSKGAKLRVEGKVVKDGKTVVFVDTNVYDDKKVLTARGEFQIYIVDEQRG